MTLPDPRDVLVFRSAQPGRSFEIWLFQKLTPGERRAVAAAIAGCGPHWRPGRDAVGIARRHGPALYEAQVCVRRPARGCPGAVRSVRGSLETIGVFFLWTRDGPIILSAGEWSTDGHGLTHNLGLGDAHHRSRELRVLEEEGYLERSMVL